MSYLVICEDKPSHAVIWGDAMVLAARHWNKEFLRKSFSR